jgi:hypothetical protein
MIDLGTFIDVYGRLPYTVNLTGLAQFVIDSGQPIVSNYPPLTSVYFDPTTLASSNYLLFHADSLTPGMHSLDIMPLASDALWLDYVNSGTGLDTINSESPQLSTPSPVPSPVPTSTASSTSASSQATSSSKRTSIVVADGIAGGIVGLTLIAVLIFFYRRRRRHHGSNANTITSYLYTQPSVSGSLKASTTIHSVSLTSIN